MDHTELHFGIRIDRIDGIGKAGQTVHRGDQNVFDAPVIEVGQNRQPEVGPFTFRQIQAQNLLLALYIQAQDGVHGLGDITAVLPQLVVNGIHPYKLIVAVQWSLLPVLHFGNDLIGDGA